MHLISNQGLTLQAYTQTLIQRLNNPHQQRIDRALALMNVQESESEVFNLLPHCFISITTMMPGYYDQQVLLEFVASRLMILQSNCV